MLILTTPMHQLSIFTGSSADIALDKEDTKVWGNLSQCVLHISHANCVFFETVETTQLKFLRHRFPQ